MGNFKDWLAKKAGSITLALSNVEKSALNRTGDMMSDDINHMQRHTQGQVVDSLVNGEITQEVMDLRWRNYKILNEVNGYTSEIVGYETDGTPIVKTVKKNKNKSLNKIATDTFDNYTLEMVIFNDDIAISGSEDMDIKELNILDKPTINYNDKGEIESATHAEIDAEIYTKINKTQKPIMINSEFTRRFFLENYTKKLHVRNISDDEKLLEFYVSSYPDEYNITTKMIINEIKKIIETGKKSDLTSFNNVEFITDKSIGVDDFLHFKYSEIKFDKIVLFNGNYVVKFKAKPTINGENIIEKYKQDILEDKYANKTKK